MTSRVVLPILGPLLVLAGAVFGLAGGGPAPAGPARMAVEAELREPSDVVLLGNSMSHSDLDLRRISATLGVKRIANPLVAGSGAPAWLAVLEARVFGEGQLPRLVLVYGTLDAMLAGKPASALGMERLDDVLGGFDGIVNRRVLDRSPGLLGRLGPARSRFHTALLDGVRDGAAGLIFGGEGEGLLERGASVSGPALDALFGEKAKLRGGKTVRVVPVQEADAGVRFAEALDVTRSVIPDLIRVAHEGGARIVFVRGPDRPNQPAGWALEAQAAALVELSNRFGAGFVDLSHVPSPAGNFRDNVHMNGLGRTALMEALLPELERLDPLGEGPMPPAPAPVASVGVRREGAPAAPSLPEAARVPGSPCRWRVDSGSFEALSPGNLAAAGLGARSPLSLVVGGEPRALATRQVDPEDACSPYAAVSEKGLTFSAPQGLGPADFVLQLSPDFPLVPRVGEEVWWVYPGTRVLLDVGGAGELGVELSGRRLGAGAAALRVGDQRVEIPAAEGLFTVKLPAAARGDQWEIEVASAGAFVVIEELVAEEAGRRRVLLGGFDPMVSAVPRWRLPARPLALLGEDGAYTHPLLASLGGEVLGPLGLGSCVPVRVTVGGERAEASSPERLAGGDRARFTIRDGRLWANRPGEVVAELAEGRTCAGGAWLYPGETATSRLTAAWSRLRVGAAELSLDLRAAGLGPDDRVHVTIADNRGALLDEDLDPERLAAGPIVVPFASPFTAPVGPLTLTLDNPTATGFLNLHNVEFRDLTGAR